MFSIKIDKIIVRWQNAMWKPCPVLILLYTAPLEFKTNYKNNFRVPQGSILG